ncbi:hypothetical protein [Candidatus Allofournierella merdipullorum]|uniref:hypothetical protein n=1 Tax=Candidatus Allofournierella merdipullorum TaxID=2838595 RepID=UPI00374E3B47
MAYDPKKKGADSIYMTDEDLKQLDQYKSDFSAAQTAGDQAGMDAAHNAAENLRKKYNYSGGADGSQFNILSSEGVKQPFSYENAPQMVDEYQGLIDKLTDKYLNRPAFSYDAESDPLYQMYKEQYTAAGKQAMEDTLGSVSARTGGLASSYATSAAQQANNAYMDALASKIPELQQLAYQMYQNEGATLESQINMLMALQSGDWDRYQTELAQYNADKNFAYNQYADDRAYNYQIGRDTILDQRDEENTAYEQGLQKAALLAQSGIFSGYADIFGLTEDETAALVKQYAKNEKMSDQEAAMALADWYLSHGDINSAVNAFQFDPSYIRQMQNAELASLYSGGSSGSSKSGSKTKTKSINTSGSIYQDMYDAGIRTEGDAYAALLSGGYSTTEAGKYAGYFADWVKNIGNSDFKNATGSNRYSNVGTKFTTSEYNKFVNEVMGNRTKTGQAQTIKDAYDEGKITEAQAEALISKFHLGG